MKRATSERLPRQVWALGLVSFLTDVGGDMVFPLLPKLVGGAAVGFVEGIADAVSHLVKPIAGARSDAMRRRKPLVLAGYGLSGLARPALALATTVPVAIALRSLDRLGKGIRSAPRDALLAASVPEERHARAFSLHRAMDHAGAVAGPAIASVLLWAGWSVREVIAFAAIPGALAFLTIVFFVKESAVAPIPAAMAEEVPRGGVPLPARLKSWLAVLFVFSLATSTDALLLARAGETMSPAATTALWTLLHVVKVIASPPGGALADRVGPVRTIFAGWIVYAIVYAGFAVTHEPAAMVALFAVYGLHHALTEGAEKALVARLAPRESRGRAFGAMAFVMGIGTLIASGGAAILYRAAGPEWAFGANAAAAVVASMLLVVWARPTRGSS